MQDYICNKIFINHIKLKRPSESNIERSTGGRIEVRPVCSIITIVTIKEIINIKLEDKPFKRLKRKLVFKPERKQHIPFQLAIFIFKIAYRVLFARISAAGTNEQFVHKIPFCIKRGLMRRDCADILVVIVAIYDSRVHKTVR